MKRRFLITSFAIAISWVSVSIQTASSADDPGKPPADVVLLDARVIVGDRAGTIHQAVAIRKGRILAVGKSGDIENLIGKRTSVYRLGGKTVVPGLIETHCHAIGVGRQATIEQYVELASIAQVQDWIRKHSKQVPAGQWIKVPRTDITRLLERRHPTTAELDAACATHPVAFNAARKWALNSLALKELGLDREGENLKGVKIIRDADGNLRLVAGIDARLRQLLPRANLTSEEDLNALAKVLHRYNEVGITSIFERATNRQGYDMYRTLQGRGDLTVRVTTTFRGGMRSATDVVRLVNDLGLRAGEGDDWVKAGPLKITVDGGIHWGNTHLREPYGEKRVKFYGLDDPDYRGDLRYSVNEMRDVFAAGHRLGWQMCCHVTGDAGVDRVLDALEAASKQSPVSKRRFTLVHAYFPTPEAIQRGHKLGVCVDTQCYLYYKDSDAIAEVYGVDWAERFIGVGQWIRGGIPVAINADHMIGLDPNHAMNAFNPFLQMYIAVSRKNDRGRVYGAHQKLSRLEALRAMTADAAYLSFDEKNRGQLSPGMLADLVVLDRDLLTCPEEEIKLIKVVMTMVDGQFVYRHARF